jgi:tRNA(Ile)-lysidine synthase
MTAADASESDDPLTEAEFAALMRPLGPFEVQPRLAVAVSGGSDSLALTLLLHGWVRAQGGVLTALTVDHGLRPEAAMEARQVERWLKARGIRHRILVWRPAGETRRGGLQAAARAARYRLLGEWCRANRVLHLALAHHREDQAETLLLRLGRGSGLDGLAAMAAVAEREGVRLIRPLLPIPRARLAASLRRAGQDWIEDPSNRDPAHARVRLRFLMPALAAEGFTAARLAATAAHLGQARAALDDAVADLLALAAAPSPAGYLHLDPAPLRAAPAEVSLRALAHVLLAVGGAAYAPRLERLERLHAIVRAGGPAGGATLGGCRILGRRGRLLICRESALAREEQPLRPGHSSLWDGRFLVTLLVDAPQAGKSLRRPAIVRRLGAEGWAAVAVAAPALRRHAIPPAARPALPALWDTRGIVSVPHLDWRRPGSHVSLAAAYAPGAALAGTRFTVA